MGLQVLFETSEEDPDTPGFGWLAGVRSASPRTPSTHTAGASRSRHMGWNQVRQRLDHPLWRGIDDAERFYFVHSYHVCPGDDAVVAGTSEYGLEFTAAVHGERLFRGAVPSREEPGARPRAGFRTSSPGTDMRERP